MTELWYPDPSVTESQHERLMGRGSPSGVIGYPSDSPLVYAPGSGTREVRVRSNRQAIVEGYGWENDASEIVLPSLAANPPGSTRVDLVVLRLDRSDWSVRVKVVQGTPGAGAPIPTYQTGTSGVWELPLAEVTVGPGVTTIGSSAVKVRHWYVGLDGQIRCTETTRPPQDAGRVIWQHPEGLYRVSNGSQWLTGVEDSGVTALSMNPTLWGSSVNRVHRRNGWVFLALSPQRIGGNVAANATVVLGTLPSGFRPGYIFEGVITKSDGGSGRLTIAPSGVVEAVFFDGLLTGRYAVFQAVSFPAV